MYKERGNACLEDLQKSSPYQFSYPVLQVLLIWGDMQALTFYFGCGMSHRKLERMQWRHA